MVAWFDVMADPASVTDAQRSGVEEIRRAMDGKQAFSEAYDRAREEFLEGAEAGGESTGLAPEPTYV